MEAVDDREAPQRAKAKCRRGYYLKRLMYITSIACVAYLAFVDVPIEGEYHGGFTDSISGRGILVLRNGEMVIRTVDGDELQFASYKKQGGVWTVTPKAGGDTWFIDRGLWSLTIRDGVKEHRFRRNLPFRIMIDKGEDDL